MSDNKLKTSPLADIDYAGIINDYKEISSVYLPLPPDGIPSQAKREQMEEQRVRGCLYDDDILFARRTGSIHRNVKMGGVSRSASARIKNKSTFGKV